MITTSLDGRPQLNPQILTRLKTYGMNSEYIRRENKPMRKEELITGIREFWRTVTAEKCTKYIRHLCKVIPKSIELNGDVTGY